MPNRSSQRRTQFSSCDACRRSRVACDASKFGHQPGKVRWTGSCLRCSLRRQPCTFEWINNVRKKPSSSREDATSQSPTAQPDSFVPCELQPDLTESVNTQAESANVLLTRWSDHIFHHGFETIFGLLIGRNGCPFVKNPASDVCIPSAKLFRKLDADIDDELDSQSQGLESEVRERRQKKNDQIEKSLSQAIQSFVARWLPLVSQSNHLSTGQVEEIIRHSWRTSRKDMLKVINRVSYRSALTLYLFSQTPVPSGISEDEEMDGINGMVCIQTALLQVQRLREGRKICQFDKPEMLASTDTRTRSRTVLTQEFLDFESRAYWAAVMWDTSSSLNLNLRTSLTSGLNGACSEPAWRLTKTFLVGSFHPETEHWRTNGFEVSDEVASRIITGAAICKLYAWKNITSLKEALREGVNEDTVLYVWSELLDVIKIFKTSIRPLLNNCERRLHFMDQLTRLSWYEVNQQYYLGIMVMVNVIEAANRFDLLLQVTEARQDAEDESFNILKFGIESTYTIYGPGGDSNTASRLDNTAETPVTAITASFVAIDPYPNHVVDSVLLMNEVIGREYRQGKIKCEAYSYLSSTLLKALEQLPQSSKTVQAARRNLQESFHKINTDVAVRG